jgi:hypothetical protein
VVGGFALAREGFSSMAMNIRMPASLMVVAWVVGVAAIHWRRSHIFAAAGALARRFQSLPKPPKNLRNRPSSAQPGYHERPRYTARHPAL